jgi:hypothetical protein
MRLQRFSIYLVVLFLLSAAPSHATTSITGTIQVGSSSLVPLYQMETAPWVAQGCPQDASKKDGVSVALIKLAGYHSFTLRYQGDNTTLALGIKGALVYNQVASCSPNTLTASDGRGPVTETASAVNVPVTGNYLQIWSSEAQQTYQARYKLDLT